MADLPRITVVTPSFNQGKYLEQTLRSVLDQGYPNLEYIVVDGGSTDDSVEIIKRYADRLAWWVTEKDCGQSDAINKGFARATGDVFGFINSDDYLYPGALDAVAKSWQDGARWVIGWVMMLEADGGELPQLPERMASPSDWFVRNPVPQQATFWAARFWKDVGQFREDLHYSFDYEYWLRLRFRAKAEPTLIHRCLGSYRLHESSKTVSQWERFEPDLERARAEYLPLLPASQRREAAKKRRHKESERHRMLAWQALKKAEVPEARKHAFETLRRAKLAAESWRLMYCALRGR
jgi:glycosyltransferase involved in cell wall biosynthesis